MAGDVGATSGCTVVFGNAVTPTFLIGDRLPSVTDRFTIWVTAACSQARMVPQASPDDEPVLPDVSTRNTMSVFCCAGASPTAALPLTVTGVSAVIVVPATGLLIDTLSDVPPGSDDDAASTLGASTGRSAATVMTKPSFLRIFNVPFAGRGRAPRSARKSTLRAQRLAEQFDTTSV